MNFLRVQERQGLRGNGGSLPEFAGGFGTGLVECLQKGITQAAYFLGINRPPVSLAWQRIRLIDGCGSPHDLPGLKSYLRIKVGPGGDSSNLEIQLAACQQHRVANLLRNQTTGNKARVQKPFGIFFLQRIGVGVPTASPVGLGGQNQLIELLDRPSVLHEPVRQVIEQGGMSGQLPGTTEIVGVTGNPTPKMPGPDPVDHDPGGQGVFLVHNPLGKGQPTLAFACGKRTGFHPSKGFGGGQTTGAHRLPL